MNSGLCRVDKPFVAEIAVDLEYFFETADHQSLEVQLRRDAQEQLHIQRVVVRHEGRAAAPPGMGCIIGVSTSRKPRRVEEVADGTG